ANVLTELKAQTVVLVNVLTELKAQYNARTQLNADVSEQNNHFDFDLKMELRDDLGIPFSNNKIHVRIFRRWGLLSTRQAAPALESPEAGSRRATVWAFSSVRTFTRTTVWAFSSVRT
ncbi:hypothetical protein AB1L30_00200, partial [Bremerella sp. JC817]|uniref:hypothetical protein n=1 Tax=Bremerella sp. JC817 TaxID=3231756 RepID=UPI00345A8970